MKKGIFHNEDLIYGRFLHQFCSQYIATIYLVFCGRNKNCKNHSRKTMNVLFLTLLNPLEGGCRCLPNGKIVMFPQSHIIKEIFWIRKEKELARAPWLVALQG
jgi:hypothetical protein